MFEPRQHRDSACVLQADCMTSSELEAFRKTVRETLEAANKEHDRDVMYRFSKEALAEAFPQHQVMLRCRWHAELRSGDQQKALPSRSSTCCRADFPSLYFVQVPPFAVVSSRQYDSSVGRYWPVRRYPWGVCEALSSEHSDVAALKKLLLELCFEEFKVHLGQSLSPSQQLHCPGRTPPCPKP
jgi:Septin